MQGLTRFHLQLLCRSLPRHSLQLLVSRVRPPGTASASRHWAESRRDCQPSQRRRDWRVAKNQRLFPLALCKETVQRRGGVGSAAAGQPPTVAAQSSLACQPSAVLGPQEGRQDVGESPGRQGSIRARPTAHSPRPTGIVCGRQRPCTVRGRGAGHDQGGVDHRSSLVAGLSMRRCTPQEKRMAEGSKEGGW